MADNAEITQGIGKVVLADEVTDATLGTGVVQMVKIMDGTLDGTAKAAVGANGLKVDGSGVTQPVSGTVAVSNLPATQPVSGTVAISGTVPVSGPLTNTELRATAVPVDGPLTDTQLRATAVPVSGTVTASGPLTDTQLRATAVPVSAAALPLPSGAATESTLGTTNTEIGATNETAASSDTATAGLNGRLQRIAQRITSLIGLFPTSLGQKAKASALAVTLASDEDLLATAGATGDAIVAAGATGSLSAKLRRVTQGLEDLKSLIVLGAGSAIIGKVGIDQTTPGTTDSVTAKVPNTAVASGAVTVGLTELALPASNLAARRAVAVFNNGTATIYVGKTGLSTSSGFPIPVGASASFDVGPGVTLYGISGTASQDVRVLELS